ncbi:MAG: hypothetical protein K2X69_02920 [Silvanigrellaceae bacterium]|nr:hypothetical protein [Silvanigrellaceae bacterium]
MNKIQKAYIENELFIPKLELDKQSHYFRLLMLDENKPYRMILNGWASGFIDRDGKDKFIKEFQSTFNSSFWELYIYAVLKKLGYTVLFDFNTPDFVCNEFVLEAVIAGPSIKGRADFAKDYIFTPSKEDSEFNRKQMVLFSCERIMNAISNKIEKFKKNYSKLEHVKNKPFVICVAPFEQELSQIQGMTPIIQCLYGFGEDIYIDSNKNNSISDRRFIGITKVNNINKTTGKEIETGLFFKPENSEISAVIFSTTATLSKVHALSTNKNGSIFIVKKYSSETKQPKESLIFDYNYFEDLTDGLMIFLNPMAKNKFDLSRFQKSGVAIFIYDENGNIDGSCNDGFLLSRFRINLDTSNSKSLKVLKDKNNIEKNKIEFNNAAQMRYNKLTKLDIVDHFYNEHWILHFKEWTILVVLCPKDNDWGWIANNRISSLQEFINNNSKDDVTSILCKSSFFKTKEEALENAILEINNRIEKK